MITIAYDITAVAESPHGGIAQVGHNTLEQAAQDPNIQPTGYYRKGAPTNINISDVRIVKHRPYHKWLGHRYHIAHSLCHRTLPVKASCHIYTVHDTWSLRPNHYQDAAFQKKVGDRLKREIQQADHIVAISETTRRHLLEDGLVTPDKCSVALLGYRPPDATADDPGAGLPSLQGRPYVLYVGCLEMRKNIGHLLDAVRPLDAVHLVIAGQPGFGYREKIRQKIDAFPQDRLNLLETVSRSQLPNLYRGAVATMLPSWEEGFGLPILEAMANSCPVVTSNRSANAEVGADAAILIDPAAPDQSQRALERLLSDKQYRDSIVAAGLKRAGQFSWGKYFRTMTDIYERVLAG